MTSIALGVVIRIASASPIGTKTTDSTLPISTIDATLAGSWLHLLGDHEVQHRGRQRAEEDEKPALHFREPEQRRQRERHRDARHRAQDAADHADVPVVPAHLVKAHAEREQHHGNQRVADHLDAEVGPIRHRRMREGEREAERGRPHHRVAQEVPELRVVVDDAGRRR